MTKISVALATHNEEKFLGDCLKSVSSLADEIVIVDGSSTDRTREIAKKYQAKVLVRENPSIFHINKQLALETCQNKWILQLDADERVTPELAREIKKVVNMAENEIDEYQKTLPKKRLFLKHQRLLEKRDGQIGKREGEYAGFFSPRQNFFLGKPLKYGGVYPDGVIRLVKKGKAHFPCKSVHEQIVVEGRVGWLNNDLIDVGDNNFKRYLSKNSRYIDLIARRLKKENQASFWQAVNYFVVKPNHWFLLTFFRHKGFLDGVRGFLFSFFSALRFPRAYWRFLLKGDK